MRGRAKKRRVDELGASADGRSRATRLQIEVDAFGATAKKLAADPAFQGSPDTVKFLAQWDAFVKDWAAVQERLASTFSFVPDVEIEANEKRFNNLVTRYEMLPARIAVARQAEQIRTLTALKDKKIEADAAASTLQEIAEQKAQNKAFPTPDLPPTSAEKVVAAPTAPPGVFDGAFLRPDTATVVEVVGATVAFVAVVALIATAARR